MRKQILPHVHCVYINTKKSITEILEESFRLHLINILNVPEKPFIKKTKE